VQQIFGEPVFGHGYLVWELPGLSAEAKHISNPCGMVTVADGGAVVVLDTGRRLPVAEAARADHFPRRPRVRVLSERVSEKQAVLAEARASLRIHGIEPYLMSFELRSSVEGGVGDAGEGAAELAGESAEAREVMRSMNQLDACEHFLRKACPERYAAFAASGLVGDGVEAAAAAMRTLAGCESDAPEAVTKHVARCVAEIESATAAFVEAAGGGAEGRGGLGDTTLIKASWGWLYGYGADCHFDFEAADGKVVLIEGPNASGKSAFLDILCLGLFGRATPTRHEIGLKRYTSHVINERHPSGGSSKVSVRFENRGRRYQIFRTFGTQKEERSLKESVSEIYSVLPDGSLGDPSVNKAIVFGTEATNQWMGENVGTLEAITMAGILSQTDSNNFMRMPQKDKSDILDSAFGLGFVRAYSRAVSVSAKKHGDLLKTVDNVLEGMATGESEACAEGDAVSEEEAASALRDAKARREEADARVAALAASLGGASPSQAAAWDPAEVDLTPFEGVSEAEAAGAAAVSALLAARRDALLASGAAAGEGEEPGEEPETAPVSLRYIEERERDTAEWLAGQPTRWVSRDAAADEEERDAHATREAAEAEADALRECLSPWSDIESVEGAEAEAEAGEADGGAAGVVAALSGFDATRRQLESVRPAGTGPRAGARGAAERELTECAAWGGRGGEERSAWLRDPGSALTQLASLGEEARGLRDRAAEGGEPPAWARDRGGFAREGERPCDARDLFDLLSRLEREPSPERPYGDAVARSAWERRRAEWEASAGDGRSVADLRVRQREVLRFWSEVCALSVRLPAATEEAEALREEKVNPKCWACRARPSVARFCALYSEVKAADARVVELTAESVRSSLEDAEGELATLEALIEARVVREAREAEVLEERAAWERAGAAWARCDELREATASAWGSVWRQAAQLRAAATGLEETAGRAAVFLREHDAWRGRRDAAEATLRACDAWDKWEAARAQVGLGARRWVMAGRRVAEAASVRAAVAASAEAAAGRFREESARRGKEADALAGHRVTANRRAAWEARRAGWELRGLEGDAERAEFAMRAHAARERARMAVAARAASEWAGAAREATAARAAESEAAGAAAVAGAERRRGSRVGRRMEGLVAYRAKVTEKHVLLEELGSWLRGEKQRESYEAWIYRGLVLPLLERECNAFLSGFEDIRVQILYEAGALGSILSFLVKFGEEGRWISMDQASGQQRFFVNLAVRLTLCRVGGASGGRLRHMFFDEGFLACDKRNIAKTGDMLQYVRTCGGSRSVFLISHQETVQECAEAVARVGAAPDGNSLLRFGSAPDAWFRRPVGADLANKLAQRTATSGEGQEAGGRGRGRGRGRGCGCKSRRA
jgi:hypothetical protein